MSRPVLPALFVALLLAGTSPAIAQILDDPRASAMSGAVRADPLSHNALLYNPAGMSRTYQYSAQGAYLRNGPGDRNTVAVSIVDSKTQPAAAVGVAYGYQFADGEAPDFGGHDARLGIAHPVLPNQLNLGVGLQYLRLTRPGLDDTSGFSLDAGLLFSPTPSLHIGVVGHNLIPIDDERYSRRLGSGVAYTAERLTLDVDFLVDFTGQEETGFGVASGMEILITESLPFRGGYEFDRGRDQHWVSGGIGFITTDMGGPGQLALSYRQNLQDVTSFVFGIALSMYL